MSAPKVEEVEEVQAHEHDHEHTHDHEGHNHSHNEVPEELSEETISVYSKNEKKARKLISKLNLKKVEGINRVTFTRSRNFIFVVANPEVYKTPSGTYVVFGEVKVEDVNQKYAAAQQAQEAAQAAAQAAGEPIDGTTASEDPASITADLESAADAPKKEEVEEEEEVDATGVDEKDIELVVDQANVSRNKAIKALKEQDGDIVNAIMSLTE